MTETVHLIGYGIAMSGAVVQSLTFIMVRRVAGSVSFYTNVFYFGWCSALLSGMAMFAFQKPVIPECGATRWFLIGVGKKYIISWLTPQDGRKKGTAKRLCVKQTWQHLRVLSRSSLNITVFWSSTKRSVWSNWKWSLADFFFQS